MPYTAAAGQPSVNKSSQQHFAMQAWDINGEANCPSSDGEPLDIIIARHLSVKVQDLPAALSALYNGMREGGFLYLQELTGPLGAAVFSLASKDKTADSRAFGPCTSVDNWRQLLAKAGFLEVSTVRLVSAYAHSKQFCPSWHTRPMLTVILLSQHMQPSNDLLHSTQASAVILLPSVVGPRQRAYQAYKSLLKAVLWVADARMEPAWPFCGASRQPYLRSALCCKPLNCRPALRPWTNG